MAIAGKVSIVPKGEWQSTAVYTRLDLVTYNRNAYLSLKNSTGIQPTNTEYWMLLIENVANTEIEALQTQIDDIVEDITDIIDGTTPVAKSSDSDLLQGFNAKQVGESGARNLIPYPYYETTHTEGGIDWVDNGDGTVTCNGTANSTSANGSYFFLANRKPLDLEFGTHTLSIQNNPRLCNCYIRCNDSEGNSILEQWTDNLQITFDIPYNCATYTIGLRVFNGNTVENLIIKPMLELGSIAHDYVPYHLGGAVDSQKLNGLKAEEFVSNENLLINANFKDPVNSSGKTEWSGYSIPCINNWVVDSSIANGATIALVDGGLQISVNTEASATYAGVYQSINSLEIGEKYTLSVSVDGNIYKRTITGGSPISGGISLADGISFFYLVQNKDLIFIRVLKGKGTAIYNWAKLERGHIATPFIPPNKEVEKLKCGATVGDADTVDGYHASELMNSIGIQKVTTTNTDLNDYKTPGIYYFTSDYAPTNIPIGVNGFLLVLVSTDNWIKQMWFRSGTLNTNDYNTFVRTSNGSMNWSSWKKFATDLDLANYLPLDGSVSMSARLRIAAQGDSSYVEIAETISGRKFRARRNTAITYLMDMLDNDNYSTIVLSPETVSEEKLLRLQTKVSGADSVTRNILHTGNSKATVISNTAPTDTSALWYDTTNKVCKYYKDGAWQQ